MTINDYNLPYDYSRCMGTDSETCQDCMRKLSPGREHWQSYISCVPDVYGECEAKISVVQWNERSL
jgi:hypothetical protein